MRKLSLAVLLSAAALATAAPAVADDGYLWVLDGADVPIDDPVAAIDMGKAVCAGLDQGHGLQTAAEHLVNTKGLTLEQGAVVVGVSVAAFCDHHEGVLRPGTLE